MGLTHSKVFDEWMGRALAEASRAAVSGDVPVGAILFDALGQPIAAAHNEREREQDATAHAEVLAIRRACAAWSSWQLPNTTLVVTLEPCAMCAGAIRAARIPRVIFGAWDPSAGAVGSTCDLLRDRATTAEVEVIPGVCEEECSRQLRVFFSRLRGQASA